MSKKKKCNDGRRNNSPPESGKFKPGQSGNLKGRPQKRQSTFEDEIKDVFGKTREVTIDGESKIRSMRQLILEQMARRAVQGDHQMLRMCLPFLKIMDDAPEFEMLPDDNKVIEHFKNRFNEDGSEKDEE